MKPIIFSTPMVQAVLAGDKTQTRRIIKTQDLDGNPDINGMWVNKCFLVTNPLMPQYEAPYKVKDILWVRETFWQSGEQRKSPDGEPFWWRMGDYKYVADGAPQPHSLGYKWELRPSVHLPRHAARLFLRITDVRAERLNNITESDARAEGITQNAVRGMRGVPSFHFGARSDWYTTAKGGFIDIWNEIHANDGNDWFKNPWVFVYTFERVKEDGEKWI